MKPYILPSAVLPPWPYVLADRRALSRGWSFQLTWKGRLTLAQPDCRLATQAARRRWLHLAATLILHHRVEAFAARIYGAGPETPAGSLAYRQMRFALTRAMAQKRKHAHKFPGGPFRQERYAAYALLIGMRINLHSPVGQGPASLGLQNTPANPGARRDFAPRLHPANAQTPRPGYSS